ncbi:MAG: GNAT family N-acetyltransferase, partial [Planctomycetota bacterium]
MGYELKFDLVKSGSPSENEAFEIQEQYKKYFFVLEPTLREAVANGLLLGAFHNSRLVGYFWSTNKEGTIKVRYLAVGQAESRKGIGSRLVEELKKRNEDAYRIQLSCRT